MANYTDYLQLSVTPESTNKTFKNWRLEIDNDTDSNMTKIDDAIKSIHDKLDGVAAGAEVNQNAFSNVKVGSTTVAADGKTDTLELAAGDNITLTPDATNDKITIAAKDTTYSSKAAASGGTDVSLVTTGEKYTWNSKAEGTHTHEADDITDLVDAVKYGPSDMVTIEAARDGLPITSFLARVDCVQDGSGDPAPDNIRPISGWTKATIHATGKNLMDSDILLEASGWTKDADGVYSGDNRAFYNAFDPNWRPYGFLGKRPLGGQFAISLEAKGTISGNNIYICVNYTDGSTDNIIVNTTEYKKYTLITNSAKSVDYIFGSYAKTGTTYIKNFQIERGNAVTAYEPYRQVFEYEFPDFVGTVYGGTLDVQNGTLTVDRKGYVFDGTENWGQFWTAPNRCFRLIKSGMQVRSLIGRASSHFANASVTSGTTAVGYYAYNGTASAVYIQFRPNLDEIPDLASWKAWLAAQYQAGTPVTCYHNLSTPEVYQLTQRKALSTFDGISNFWCNAGQVTIEYGGFLQYMQSEQEEINSLDASIRGTMSNASLFSLNPIAFPIWQDNIVVNTSSSKRTANIHRNYLESIGQNLSGSTYHSLCLTSGRVVATAADPEYPFVLYKSDFKPVDAPAANGYTKLILTIHQYRSDVGTTSNPPQYYVATYDEGGKIYWDNVPATMMGYSKHVYEIDPSVFTNGNICVFMQFRRPTHTLKVTLDLDIVMATTPVSIDQGSRYFYELVDSGLLVQEDPASTTMMSASPMALGGVELNSVNSMDDEVNLDEQDETDTM